MVRNLLMTAVAFGAMTAVVAAGYVLPNHPPSPPDEHEIHPPCLDVDKSESAMIRRIPGPIEAVDVL